MTINLEQLQLASTLAVHLHRLVSIRASENNNHEIGDNDGVLITGVQANTIAGLLEALANEVNELQSQSHVIRGIVAMLAEEAGE